ncbi:MAG TPA: phosphoserine phosphatase SerB [Allosphingosinicella sp.]
MFIATLIAADRLSEGEVRVAEDALAAANVQPLARQWVEPGIACDIRFSGGAASARAALEGLLPGIDAVVQPEAGRRKALLVADMDSTMITIECIDELADYAGVKTQVADVTERAMRGELQFEEALHARVALLAGLDEAVIDRCHAERLAIMPGARALVRTMRAHGATCILVSGGFTSFADRVAEDIGFNRAIANRLNVAGGRLVGTVGHPIVGADAKLEALTEAVSALSLDPTQVLAVGDGANDIKMLEAAGLGVAYRAKPRTRQAADASVDACDLTALLYAQGYPRSAWAADQ